MKQDHVEVLLDSSKQDMRITGTVVSYSHVMLWRKGGELHVRI